MASSSSPPPPPPPPILPRRLLALIFALAVLSPASAARIPASLTPISRDLYHSSDSLLREIKALVAQHPDRLTMDTVRASNKGYSAEMFVVTFNHAKETVDNGSKINILLKGSLSSRALGSMAENLLPPKLHYACSIF